MLYLKRLACALLALTVLWSLSGCGSSGGTTTDPLSPTPNNSNNIVNPVLVPPDPAVKLELKTDLAPSDGSTLPAVDVKGTVLLTATATKGGAAVQGQPVEFSVIAGPGTIVFSTAFTDRNGEAKAVLTVGDVPYTTNLIVEADSVIEEAGYRAYTAFQIVRGSGVIMFTDKAGAAPRDQVNTYDEKDADVVEPASAMIFLQQLPFKVTDSNGHPRVGVPVTLTEYSRTGAVKDIYFLPDRPDAFPPISAEQRATKETVITDSAGMGIFNVMIRVGANGAGQSSAGTVVFKAAAASLDGPNPGGTSDVIAYVGLGYNVSTKKAE